MIVVPIATAVAIVAFLAGTATGQMAGVGVGMLIGAGACFVGLLLGEK
jgi:hypothetical protein